MKVFKRFLCGVALSALALGAGAVLLNAKKDQSFVAHAEVVAEEAAGPLHLDTAKVKGYAEYHFETMIGPKGNVVTAYVFSAEGNCAKNPEVRWVSPGAGGDAKVAYPETVTKVSFWYKLINYSEKNAADAAVPYLTQVIDVDGSYPIHDFAPIKDGNWHPYVMDVDAGSQDEFDGFIIKAGDIKGQLTVADIRVNADIVEEEPEGILHLDTTKIKGYEDYYFEAMEGPHGMAVTSYVFTASGNTAKNPEVRWVVPGANGDTKVAYPEAVTKVSFFYKLVNSSEKDVADASAPYITQVIGAPSGYPIHAFEPVKDGEWHQYVLTVDADYQNKFDGFIIKAGDINGKLTVANIKLNAEVTDTEPVSELHIDQSKIKKVKVHYENMAGPDGNMLDAYVLEGSGNMYLDGTMPEVRFLSEGSNGSTKIPFDHAITTVHFWYKLTNTSENDSEIPGEPYCLQVVTEGGYPKYHFNPIKDGKWHPWTVEVEASEQNHFVGLLVEFGDLNGTFTITNLELNEAYKDATNMITFKNMGDNYDYLDNLFVNFLFEEQLFGTNLYINDHWREFLDGDSQIIDLLHGIKVNDKTLYYWTREYTEDGIHEEIADDSRVMASPMSSGNHTVYGPVAVEIRVNSSGKQEIDFKVNLDVFPMDSLKITFVSGLFRGYYNDTNYELAEDVTFYYTLPDNSAEFNAAFMTRTPNEQVTDLGINHIDKWTESFNWYVIWTDIPRNWDLYGQGWLHDHYRYHFCDILLNDVPVNDYNSWARGNHLDFDAEGNWNEAYTTVHPTGSPTWNFDYAIQVQSVTDTVNHVYFVRFTDQFKTDRGISDVNFSLREGALFQSYDLEGNAALLRYLPSVMAEERAELKAEIANYKNPALYTRSIEQFNEILANANAALDAMHYENGFADIVANAKAALDALKVDGEVEQDAQAAALAFAEQFMTTVGGVCDADGQTDRDQLDAAWAAMSTAFNDLGEDVVVRELAQQILRDAEPGQGGAIGEFASLYDYIVQKYGSEAYADFANRFGGAVVPATPTTSYPGVMNVKNNSYIIVIVAALITSLSVGLFFIVRRRRHEK